MKVEMFVNGEPVVLDLHPETLVRDAKERALARTRNTQRPASDWEVRVRTTGDLVDGSFQVWAFEDDPCFLVSLPVGYGG